MSAWEAANKLTAEGKSFVMVTVISSRGSVPQELGAKVLITRDGLCFGTIGGGKVEFAAIKKAQLILEAHQTQPPELVTWNLQKDIGMSCGGEASFLFEHFHQAAWPIVIFGAGHVAQALTGVLSKLHCQLICIDPRQEWIAKLETMNCSHLRAIVATSPQDLIPELNPKSFFLSMTMGHDQDLPILHQIFEHAPDAPYVGVIGSDVKAIRIRRELKELGVSETFLEKLHVPMGLPIGSNHPEEIAISIAAELIQIRDQFYGLNLR